MDEENNEPTSSDLISPEFNAVWEAIKGWDLERERGEGYAGATGTDVMIILNALRNLDKEQGIDLERKKVIEEIREWSEGQSITIKTTSHKSGQPFTDAGILQAHLNLNDFLNKLLK